jgi:TPR repeat protein
MTSHESRHSVSQCFSPWGDLYIHLNGDVKPCCYAHGRLGSLARGDTITSILNGSLRAELQDWTRQNRVHPICAYASCAYVDGLPAAEDALEERDSLFREALEDSAGIETEPELLKAAAHQHPHRVFTFANHLWRNGNYSAGLKWLRRGAVLRDVFSLHLLGSIYTNGWALPAPDLAEARRLYGEGAALGHAPAMVRLGAMLARGEGGPADVERGVALVREATKQGEKTAWAVLADLIEAGLAPSRHPERDIAAYRARAA